MSSLAFDVIGELVIYMSSTINQLSAELLYKYPDQIINQVNISMDFSKFFSIRFNAMNTYTPVLHEVVMDA